VRGGFVSRAHYFKQAAGTRYWLRATDGGSVSYAIHAGDTIPKVAGYVVDQNGDPRNLTGCTVTFSWWPVGNEGAAIDGVGALSGTPTDGYVEYGWTAGQTNTPGRYLSFFTLTGGTLGSGVMTCPSSGFLDLEFLATP
jgi:hypothetical protein